MIFLRNMMFFLAYMGLISGAIGFFLNGFIDSPGPYKLGPAGATALMICVVNIFGLYAITKESLTLLATAVVIISLNLTFMHFSSSAFLVPLNITTGALMIALTILVYITKRKAQVSSY